MRRHAVDPRTPTMSGACRISPTGEEDAAYTAKAGLARVLSYLSGVASSGILLVCTAIAADVLHELYH